MPPLLLAEVVEGKATTENLPHPRLHRPKLTCGDYKEELTGAASDDHGGQSGKKLWRDEEQ